MSKSFISEHSAEFVLVPQLASILSTQYKLVVPIYFWAGREGSNISLQCIPQGNLRVVAMYARRPKIVFPGQEVIEIKFNDTLFRRSNYFVSKGIPVFAGVPNISNLMDFQIGTKCSWFYLRGDDPENEEVTHLDISSGQFDGNYVSGPLSTEDILDYVRRGSKPLEWSKAVEIIRRAGRINEDSGYGYWRFNSYKPVYFLLWDTV